MIRHRIARAPSPRPRRLRRIARPGLESLETRALLSAVDTVLPAVASVIAAQGWHGSNVASPAVTNPTPIPGALTPAQIVAAYGFDSSPNAGEGMTIAIVDAYHSPTVQSDLAMFSSHYGLPAASLKVVNQRGQTTGLPATDPGWALEIALDVQWAHAVAPAADILLVEASSARVTDLMAAVRTASKSADVVSMSWGAGEWSGQRVYESKSYFANPDVTYVAASGDDGGAYGVKWPASSPNVLGVGGTTLSVSSAGAYQGETAWNGTYSPWYGYTGSTGGVSGYARLPSFQSAALGSQYATGRTVPDVSIDGNPGTGVSVYNTTPGLGQTGWFQVGGTSAGAPMWAGLIAVADQARASSGLSPLSTSQTLKMLYTLYGTTSSNASTYANSFRDIVNGSNYAGAATAGYDRVTGLGSPIAGAIVAAAATYGASSSSAAPDVDVRADLMVRFLIQPHTAFGSSNITVVVVATVTITTNSHSQVVLAALALPASPTVSTAAPAAAAFDAPALEVAGRALPNQSTSSATLVRGVSHAADRETVVFNIETPYAIFAPFDAPATPERGDFLSPPRLVPGSPVDVWDEALTHLGGRGETLAAEPAAFEPWTAVGAAEEDLSESAPTLLGAAGLAAFFWLSWNRRTSGEDERRRASFIPTPLDN